MYEEDTAAANERKETVSITNAHGKTPRQGSVVERLSKYGMQVMPSAFQRRTMLQRQQQITETSDLAQNEAPERASMTPAMRKKYLKELLLTNKSHSVFSSVLSCQTGSVSSTEETQDADWALYPMEHAWMLSAVEGNYDTIVDYISEDPYLLTRKDFISGYTVLHWLAKRGQDDTLLKLLHYAQTSDIPVNVNARGSGGLTPLHLASMHGQYMVIKLLVGAFGANVDVMDYNGKRAWQYLKGDAPLEMKELLGTWDDEHCSRCAQNANKNNNCTNAMELQTCDEVQSEADESYFLRTESSNSQRFGSFRKLFQSFTFLRNNS